MSATTYQDAAGQRSAHEVSGSRAQRLRRQKGDVVSRVTTPTASCVRGSFVAPDR
jgi:hypothetical protein